MNRFLGIILSGLLFVSCDESLPPRNEPTKFLEASYFVTSGAVEVRDSTPTGLVGAISVSVKNVYDEVLQSEEFAQAELDVWMLDAPGRRGKVVATSRNLTDQSLVSGRQLTLRPNVTALFLKQWEHATVEGKHFWEFVNSHFVAVPNSNGYWESAPVRLVASGRVQLFKDRAPELLPQIQFTLIYRVWLP